MTHFKNFKTSLSANGYSHHWKLIKSTQLPIIPHEAHPIDFSEKVTCQIKKPSCQHIDLVIPNRARTQSENNQLDQFLQIIGTRLPKNSILKTNKKSSPPVAVDNFERDDDKRAFRIQEFIKTEQSYIKTLNALLKYAVNPLKSVMHRKDCILNAFKCTKIFLNVDQITSANQKFLNDLLDEDSFGATCQKHMKNFECYRKYLLEQGEAQKLHTKEYKSNPAYKRFLSKAREHPDFKKRRLEDILVEPVQRISRYSMMLRDILQLTPKDHPDYPGLKSACEKSRTIATLDDDDPTKAATMLLSLYQAIRESPCSLINQNRSFVAHLDAMEIHGVTNKPTRAVTLFLFTDKILVASRSSLDSKEVDIEELLDTNTPILYSKLTSKKESALRFRGWADIETIELFDGVSDRPGSFILSANSRHETHDTNINSFEHYFYKGPRLFSFLPPKEDLASHQINDHHQKWLDFKSLYQKTAALVREYEPNDLTFHRLWNDVPVFCNIYDQETYTRVKYKSDCTLIYADTEFPAESLFLNSTPTPWTIGLVYPEDMKGFRFNLCTKVGYTDPYRDRAEESQQTLDFESIFWNNLCFLNQCLRFSPHYIEQNAFINQRALSRSLSRSKPITRATSIPTLGKLFSGSEELRISSSYDKKFMSQVKLLPPLKQQYSDTTKRLPVHSWSGVPSEYLSPEKEFTCDDLLLNVIQERSNPMRYTEDDQDKKNDTISSRGSSSSTASSFSMIDDDGDEENEEGIDLNNDIHSYLPIAKVSLNRIKKATNRVLNRSR
ncbi:hypothetical protein BY458DRAFT_279964 [Sporodiniella umbellata]|nr:hypothetical protein BY458DRAFT_279964 [Sporodiniella umbellata]